MTREMKTSSDSFRMPFQGGISSIHNRQYQENFLAANKSHSPLQLNFFNRRDRKMPLQPISMPNSSAFGLNQSFTSLNPTMMRAQEQNLLNSFNHCQVSFNFKSCKSSRQAIPSAKPIKHRPIHMVENYFDSD